MHHWSRRRHAGLVLDTNDSAHRVLERNGLRCMVG